MTARVLVLLLVACKSDPKPAGPPPTSKIDVATGSGDIAEARLGPPNAGGERELAFAITRVYEQQQPSATAPYHADGGTWTYFDARLVADPVATFTVGLPKLEGSASGFGGFAKLWLVPTTAEAGKHFLTAFAQNFQIKPPPPHPGTLAPQRVPLAVLGNRLARADNSYNGLGTWTATKLFLSSDTIDSAELFFNVSVVDKQGVFSEKDASYDQDVAEVLANALRDGVPPPRTAQNDPTISPRPLGLVLGKPVASSRTMLIGQSPARVLVTEMLDDHASLLAIDLASGETKELYRTPDRLYTGVCEPGGEHCVLDESRGKDRHTFSGDDTAKLVVLDGDKVTALPVPEGGKSPRPTAVSPDGRFVIVSGDRSTLIVDRKTRKTTRASDAHAYREVIGWRGGGVAVVALLDLDKSDAPKRYAAWHLDAGTLEPLATTPESSSATSPDGTRTVQLGDGKVTVSQHGGTSRTLQLAPGDAKWADETCCRWLDNRYLSFRTRRFGVIDTDEMKVAFVAQADDDERPEPVPGSLVALVRKDHDTYLARIVP